MKKTFFKTVKFYSLLIMALGGLILFTSLVISNFNLGYLTIQHKIVRQDNVKNTYTEDLTNILQIKIDTQNTNVKIIPSESNEFRVTYFENQDEKYSILKSPNVISLNYRNVHTEDRNLIQKIFLKGIDILSQIPYVKTSKAYAYERNDLIIEIPDSYSGDISISEITDSEKATHVHTEIDNLKNINNLDVNTTSSVLKNISCKNIININTATDCSVESVCSQNSIKINSDIGYINLSGVSSKNLLSCTCAEDGDINASNIDSDRIYLHTPFYIVANVCGYETDYITIKEPYNNRYINTGDIKNDQNKKVLVTSQDSIICFKPQNF